MAELRNVRFLRVAGLVVGAVAVVFMWLHLAFGSFNGAAWYYPVLVTLQITFIVTQLRVALLLRETR